MYGDGSKAQPGSQGKPLPEITPLNRPFWDLVRQSVFSIQTCKACGHKHVPESPVCPQCLSADQEWQPASGRGTIESWVDFHHAYWDGFKEDLPYRVCLVRLEEGPLFVSNLLGDQQALKHGAPARVVFRRVTDEVSLPGFELIQA
jgi:uncharacterized OB-fold protein